MNKYLLYGFNLILIPINILLILFTLAMIFSVWVNNNLLLTLLISTLIWFFVLVIIYLLNKKNETDKKIKRFIIAGVIFPCIYGIIWFCGYLYILFFGLVLG
jgi:hypothetical protein